MLSSLQDYFYERVQRTNRVWSQVQHQQNHNELVVDYNSLNMDAAAKMQQISKT